MSKKNVQKSVSEYFNKKRQRSDDDESENDGDIQLKSTDETQSKHDVMFNFDLMRVKPYENGINQTILFDFDFNFLDTSTRQSHEQRVEIPSAASSKLKVEVNVRLQCGKQKWANFVRFFSLWPISHHSICFVIIDYSSNSVQR